MGKRQQSPVCKSRDKMLFKKTKEDIEKANLKRLSKYIHSTLSKGFSEEDIRRALLSENWPLELINKGISEKRIANPNTKETGFFCNKSSFMFSSLFRPENKIVETNNTKEPKIKNKRRRRLMPKKLNAEQAKSFLRQIDQEKGFWVNNGAVLTTLEEFSKELKSMESEKFSYHVNTEKNDFANWINDIIGDQVLAKNISKIKTQKTLAKTVGERVSYLKKLV